MWTSIIQRWECVRDGWCGFLWWCGNVGIMITGGQASLTFFYSCVTGKRVKESRQGPEHERRGGRQMIKDRYHLLWQMIQCQFPAGQLTCYKEFMEDAFNSKLWINDTFKRRKEEDMKMLYAERQRPNLERVNWECSMSADCSAYPRSVGEWTARRELAEGAQSRVKGRQAPEIGRQKVAIGCLWGIREELHRENGVEMWIEMGRWWQRERKGGMNKGSYKVEWRT